MTQAFVTTYRNHFKWNIPRKLDPCIPVDTYNSRPLTGDMWYNYEDFIVDEYVGEDLADMEEKVRLFHKRPVETTYQKSFCRKKHKGSSSEVDNELLQYAKKIYNPEPQKILPPSEVKRRFLGHITPSTMYTPLSHYQNIHGRLGYKIMDDNVKIKNDDGIESDNDVKESSELKDLVSDLKIKDILERSMPKHTKKDAKRCKCWSM